jgi:hypothetical protein
MKLPTARGPISAELLAALAQSPDTRVNSDRFRAAARAVPRPLEDEDVQLALAVAYELHFGGFSDVDSDWEWAPELLAARLELEAVFDQALRQECAVSPEPQDICAALRALVSAERGPTLSGYLARGASIAQFREFVAQRSIYHLREADPHTFGIPRLTGRAKSALVEIQSDEYGGGIPGRMHSELYGQLMQGIGLIDEYGWYWNSALAETFATLNAMSLFALHRGRRAALLGHLAALEMTSTAPNRRFGNGLRRLGYGADTTRFYDEHVEADAVHEQLACVDLCGSFVADEPASAAEVLFGARCCLMLDARFAEALLSRWNVAN